MAPRANGRSASRTAIASAALLVTAAAVAWLAFGGGAPPAAEPAAAGAHEDAPAPPVAAPAGTANAGTAPGSEPTRTAIAAGGEPAAATAELRVQAIERGSQRPLPGAVVTCAGKSGTCDADGIARLPRPPHVAFVEAKLATADGKLYGRALVADRDPIPVVLEPDHALRVVVVDGSGHPQPDAEVRLEASVPGTPPRTKILGITRDDGRLDAEHVHVAGGGTPWVVRWRDVERLAVRAGPIGGNEAHASEPVLLDPRRLPDEPVRLVLAGTGGITVRLVLADGTPFREYCGVSLEPLAAANTRAAGTWFTSSASAHRQCRDGDGMVRWKCVAVGRRYRVRVQASRVTTTHEVQGPTRSGEVVTADVVVALAPPPPVATLTGRLLDAAGAPHRRMLVRVFRYPGAVHGDVTTDDAGGFELPLAEGLVGQVIEDLVFEGREGPRPSGLMLLHEQALVVRLGANHVGDLTFAERPLLVSGKVTDAAGKPPPRVMLGVALTAALGEPPRPLRGPDGAATLALDPDGTFRIWGWVREAAPCLVVQPPPGYLPMAPIAFQPGRADLHVVLREGGRLQATVLHDDDLEAKDLAVELEREQPRGAEPPPGSRRGSGSTSGSPREGRHTWEWRGLEAGTYRLEVGLYGAPRSTRRTVPGIVVAEGADCDDSRLRAITLDASRRAALTIVDANGAPLTHPFAHVQVEGASADDGEAELLAIVAGRARVPLTGGSADVVVRVPGFAIARRTVTGDTTVALQQAPVVRLHVRLPQEPPLPERCRLSAMLLPSPSGAVARWRLRGPGTSQNGDGLLSVYQRSQGWVRPVGDDGIVELLTTGVGPHEVLVRAKNVPLQSLQPTIIEVRDTPAPQSFEIEVPPAALAPLLRETPR